MEGTEKEGMLVKDRRDKKNTRPVTQKNDVKVSNTFNFSVTVEPISLLALIAGFIFFYRLRKKWKNEG
ncbi:hypothetical protein RCG23_03730 [Neobacillus sp. PS3-34]|uniref:hypothetical protein n=1 Tax=Neobacillus sp. PS3-34 TaxID=3070678 RepID=UPI0027E1EAFA|nr:hypothetical protein [Neobacillus sp. PS3-34]WML49209.1 hypothetical protein RCG23_03730 [Neobacillus sp. PS3-34]